MTSTLSRSLATALLLCPITFTWAAKPTPVCEAGAAYAGPTMTVPEAVWRTIESNADIQGEFDPALAAALDTSLEQMLAHYPAVSAAIAIPGNGIWQRTVGKADLGANREVTANSRFQIASISKAFTAAVVIQLVNEQQLALTDTLDRWFPKLKDSRFITIENLLDHRSGLVSFNTLPEGRTLNDDYHSPDELIDIVSEYPLQFCPGEHWAYTNTGYVLLGLIVERLASAPFSHVIADRILTPLGLASTAMRHAGDDDHRVVTGHQRRAPITSAVDYATPFAAGSIASTAGDTVRFWHALLTARLLPTADVRAAFATMFPMQPMFPAPPDTRMYYGRGVQYTVTPGGAAGPGPMLVLDGGMPGFNATVAYLTLDNVYIAVLTNDKEVPAAAGLWGLVRTLRSYRAGDNAEHSK